MRNVDSVVTESLLSWYGKKKRDLPWRRTRDPYRVWLAEVMLQQTRVEAALPYYERFVARFPSIDDLAAAREDDVLALWSGLGYYRRARSLLAGAREVVARFGGEFPGSLKEALGIPGVGPYTAAAILSMAYGHPHPVVDGNVERVITRFLRVAGNPKQAQVARSLREIAGRWLPPDRPGDFNQALMELGATVCVPLSPKCELCPLEPDCAARRRGDPGRFPQTPPRRPGESMDFEVGLLERRGTYLLERPRGLGFLEGLWVFPLAPVGTRTKGAKAGVARTLSSGLDAEVRVTGELASLRHSITYRRLTLHPKLLTARGVDLRGRGERFRWARLSELGEKVPVSSICLKIARILCRKERRRANRGLSGRP